MSQPLSPILPSVFELLAQERFTRFVRSTIPQALKFLRGTPLKSLYLYKDEFALLIESLLQWFYLHFHSALAGEHYYGLKRTANHRLRSLILSVFLPYVKVKLNSLQDQIKLEGKNPKRNFFFIAKILPKLQIFLEAIGWLYRLSYGCGLSDYYSPTLQLANVKLAYAKDPSPIPLSKSLLSRFVSIISQIVSTGLFIIQMIDWWKTTNAKSVLQPCFLCRKTCQEPTGLVESKDIYCYRCIDNYIHCYHRCPRTNRPVTHEQLIRLLI